VSIPGPYLEFASVVVDSRRLIVYGGRGVVSDTDTRVPEWKNEIWEYWMTDHVWKKVTDSGDGKPPPLIDCKVYLFEQFMIVAGGHFTDGTMNTNMYVYNIDTKLWMLVQSLCVESDSGQVCFEANSPQIFSMNARASATDSSLTPFVVIVGGQDAHGDTNQLFVRFSLDSDLILIGLINTAAPFLSLADSLSVPVQDGIVSFGGHHSGFNRRYVSYLKFGQDFSTTVYWGEVPGLLYGGSAVYFGRFVYVYGALAGDNPTSATPIPYNAMIIFPLNAELFQCSPGTHTDLESTIGKCAACPVNDYSAAFGKDSCDHCTSGSSTMALTGSRSLCFPVHDPLCQPTSADRYCPVGAPAPIPVPKAPTGDLERAHDYKPAGLDETPTMIICYIVSIVVGAAVAIVLLFIPRARWFLYAIDIFTEEYDSEINEESHEGVKTVKETPYGGMLVVVGAFFIVGGVILLIYKYVALNTLETMSILDSSMDDAFTATKMENKNIQIDLTLSYYSGPCAATPDETAFPAGSDCSPRLGFGLSGYIKNSGLLFSIHLVLTICPLWIILSLFSSSRKSNGKFDSHEM
jgi:hypothetical protein